MLCSILTSTISIPPLRAVDSNLKGPPRPRTFHLVSERHTDEAVVEGIQITSTPLSVDPVARIVESVSKLTLLTQFRVEIDTLTLTSSANVEFIEPDNVKNVNFDTKLCQKCQF